MSGASLRTDLVIGLRIAVAEIRDQFRNTMDSQFAKAMVILAIPFIGGGVLLFFNIARTLGVATRGGTDFPIVSLARSLFLPMLLVLVFLTALNAMQSLARDSVRPLLLTSVSGRALIIGKLVHTLYTQLLLVGLGFVLVAGYAAGARAPLFLVVAVAAGLPVLLLAIAVGLSVGYLFWLGTAKLGLAERIRRLVTASLSVGFFTLWIAVVNTDRGDVPYEDLATRDPMTPLGWYADLLFVGSPVAEPLGPRTAVAAVLVLCALPLVVGGLVRLAPAYWYATPTAADETADQSRPAPEGPPSATVGRTSGLLGRSQTLRAALGYGRDAVRRPDQFVFFFNYLFIGAAGFVSIIIDRPADAPWLAGSGLLLLGAFLGAVFCLNPLGSEGQMLPQLTLAQAPAGTFVGGRIIVGTAVGLPFSLVGVGLLGAFNPFVTPGMTLVGLVLTPAVVLASVCFAQGIGSALPKFETGELFNIETKTPSRIAVYIHAGVVLAVTGIGIAVCFAVASPESTLSVPVRAGVFGAYLLSLFVLADGSRRYAAGKLADYGQPVRVDRTFAVEASVGLAAVAFVFAEALALFAAVLLGFALLPLIFVVEYVGFVLVAAGFLYVTHRDRSYLDLDLPEPRHLALVGGAVLGSLAIALVGTTLLSQLGLPGIDNTLSDPAASDTIPGEFTGLVLFVAAMLFVVGPVEELLFRNIIQKYLAEWFPVLTAVAIASAIFTLVHVPVYLLTTGSPVATGLLLSVLFVISSLWGVIYARTQRLVVVAAIHGLYNASLACLVVLG